MLRADDQLRRWSSLDDERVCTVCARRFTGRQIEIRCFPSGRHELRCPTPGCNSRLQQWVYAAKPLVSDMVNADWWRPAARGHARTASGQLRIRRQITGD